MRLRSRPRPPASVVSTLRLQPKERMLAWATDPSGRWYVGTDLAVYLPTGDDGYRRLGWEDVERADWQRDDDKLSIVEVAEWGEPEPSTVFEVGEPGRLLELIRERVTSTVVCTLFAPVRGSAGLTVVGRRAPSRDRPVQWSYVLSPRLDPEDPAVVDVAAQTLAQAQREVEGL